MQFSPFSDLPGATLQADKRCRFKVWAPLKHSVTLHLPAAGTNVEMKRDRDGYFTVTLDEAGGGTDYFFSLDGGKRLPDPASQYQPEGVHGASRVVDHALFNWTDESWKGVALEDLVLYELHVGTFTSDGTFEAIIPLIGDLRAIGVTAIQLMPVAQFPGTRNWGYDGVFPYAVQNSYGGPDGLKKLVNACHLSGMAVVLDVVYNHLGPEGNCFIEYGPYFTSRYSTPWGNAINFDDAWADPVREYFCNNALYWFHHYHIDGLRLDAVHMIFDNGAVHFLEYLNRRVRDYQQHVARPLHMIAESDLNSPRVVNPPSIGGYDFTCQWLDDFHHALYVLLDSRGKERYEDFGSISQLAKAYKEGFVHSGEYVSFRKRKHGTSSVTIPGNRFVAFTCNHDQAGNRPRGERLSALIDFERLKVAAGALIVAPYIPMLFMGDEYGEDAPFYYFISHSDAALVEAVRSGRKEEFSDFPAAGESPDPQDPKTFEDCRLRRDQSTTGHYRLLLSWHRTLIALRNATPALKNFSKNDIQALPVGDSTLVVRRCEEGGTAAVLCVMNFDDKAVGISLPWAEDFRKILDSRDAQWSIDGSDAPNMPDTLKPGELFQIRRPGFAMYKACPPGDTALQPGTG